MITITYHDLYNHFSEVEEEVAKTGVKINLLINNPLEEELETIFAMIDRLADNVHTITFDNANITINFPVDIFGHVEIIDSIIKLNNRIDASSVHIISSTVEGHIMDAAYELTVDDSVINDMTIMTGSANIIRSELIDVKLSQSEDNLNHPDPKLSITNSTIRAHNVENLTIDGELVEINGSLVVGGYRIIGMTVVLNGVNFSSQIGGELAEIKTEKLVRVKTDLYNVKITRL